MSQLILTRSSQFHRALRIHAAFPVSLRVGKFFLFFSLTFVIGLLSFFYLLKFTEIHTKGYELRKLEIERARLMTAKEIHNTNIAGMKSLSAIRGSQVTRNLVPARSPLFVKQDGSVALR